MDIRKIKDLRSSILMRKKNVIGVGVGRKITGGEETGEDAIVVFVEKKQTLEELDSQDVVPKNLGDFKTDVVETDMPRIHEVDRKVRHRPAMPGTSIGHHKITAGTFGCVVYRDEDDTEYKWVECDKTGAGIIKFMMNIIGLDCKLMRKTIATMSVRKRYILSNNHVLANSAFVGDPDIRGEAILQPGKHDGGRNPEDKLAELHDYVEIDPNWCYVDCAIAKPMNDSNITDGILDIGVPAGINDAVVGLKIKKSGRTTGLTTGWVLYTNVDINVNYGSKGIVLCKNQILCSAMSQGGDSGSAVLDTNNNIVGLLFAGSQNFMVMNPIQKVFEELNITL